MEDDYSKKLSKKDQQWLGAFNESESGGNPKCLSIITHKPVPAAERKRLYREIKRYQRDTMSCGNRDSIDVYFGLRHADMRSNEDAVIEKIDMAIEIENVLLEYLKQAIKKRNWNE